MLKKLNFGTCVLGLLLCAWLVSAAHAAPERGVVPVPIKDKGGKQVLLYKESHALVIGVSEYTNGWPRLPGALEDIRAVKAALETQGFHVVMVQNPTRETMAKAFDDFINKYGHGEDNRLLFYFAGHGYTDKPTYGGEMGYIVPADAPDPNRDKTGFLSKAMDMEMFNVYAKRVRAKHALFLFDSCFSGSLFALSRAIPEAIQEKTSRAVRQFITAGTADQMVPDRSLFRDQLVRALNGEADLNKDGYVTGTELGQFLEDTVTNYSHRSQTPKYGKISDPNLDKGDFVFALKTALTPADMEQEKRKVIEERTQLEEKRKSLEAEKQLVEERRKLEEERERLAKLEEAKSAEKSRVPVLQPKRNNTIVIVDLTPNSDNLMEAGTLLKPLLEKSLIGTKFIVDNENPYYQLKFKVSRYQEGSRWGLGVSDSVRGELQIKVALYDGETMVGAWQVNAWVRGGIMGGSRDELFKKATDEILKNAFRK